MRTHVPQTPANVRNPAWRRAALALLGLLIALSGCGSLHGRWKLTDVKPNREVFAIDDAVFARDGSYAAKTTFEGRTAAEKGAFQFNGFKLRLRPQAGGLRTYNAVLFGDKLELRGDNGEFAVLRRVHK